jgi:hypothetical protein
LYEGKLEMPHRRAGNEVVLADWGDAAGEADKRLLGAWASDSGVVLRAGLLVGLVRCEELQVMSLLCCNWVHKYDQFNSIRSAGGYDSTHFV